MGLAAIVVVVAVVVGAVALLSDDSGDSSSKSKGSESESNAVALSESELISKVGDLGQTVYWIGPRAGTESYELSSTSDGSVYIRYLTGDAKAGEQSADFVTVGTYPVPKAQQALEKATEKEGGDQKLSKHDGFEVVSSPQATSAYVVFDDQPELQIEIFSPQQGEAAGLATSGALKPVE